LFVAPIFLASLVGFLLLLFLEYVELASGDLHFLDCDDPCDPSMEGSSSSDSSTKPIEGGQREEEGPRL
jgi:hypothetical protein